VAGPAIVSGAGLVEVSLRIAAVEDLEGRFGSACWRASEGIARPFVRYPCVKPSPGMVWRDSPPDGQVTLSVVVPTSDAYRGGYFPKLLVQISLQDFSDFELIVVRGDPRQGRAINVGAALARGEYLLTLDDDTSLPDPKTFSKLVAFMETDPDIGLAGGNNVIPPDANPLVRRVMRELPRRSWEPVREIVDSDLAEHPCLIMRTAEFKAVGGENELVPRGLDPYLRQAFRQAGKRVVVVPNVIYHHLPPNSLGGLLRQFFRNGRQAAFTNRHYPEWVIETPSEHGPFRPRVSFPLRVLRFPVRLLSALVTGKPLWFLCELAYALGFAREWASPKEKV
jgi:GT2 family glycosyltransferase